MAGLYFHEPVVAHVPGLPGEGQSKETHALLVREPHNPHDPNAVAVMIGELRVGHLPREVAATFAPLLQQLEAKRQLVRCPAIISARARNRVRGRGDGDYFGIDFKLGTADVALDGPHTS